MKKIIGLSLILVLSFMLCFTEKVFAANITPEYDATFNNNSGAFYANGNDITIKKDDSGNTVVYWDGGSQVVPETVTIAAGGKQGTNYGKANLVMESGKVSNIYGGGISLDSNNIAKVENSSITINGGEVINTVSGGGLLFTTTQNTEVIINGGKITAICGGGMAAATISGVTYAAGTETDLINSKNRTINTKVIINGKEDIDPEIQMIFGGGQGYSYTENVDLIINGGNLSNAYVTAGGSNGYTKNANLNIKGGNINILQNVNRGKVEKVDLLIEGGNINRAYVAGETEDPTVTGIIDKVDFKVLGGKVQNLLPGKSNNVEINIDQEKFKVVAVEGRVINDKIGTKEEKITYSIEILDRDILLSKNDTKTLRAIIRTEPAGYESLFINVPIIWDCSKSEVAKIDYNGNLKAIDRGNAIITARVLDQSDSTIVSVNSNQRTFIIMLEAIALFSIIVAIICIIVLSIYLFLR